MKERNLISNNNGIVVYGNYWAAALTSTFGRVGDMLLVIQNNKSVYPVIIADTKNQKDSGCNKWGHHYGKCIVEFEVLSSYRKSLYGKSGGFISDKINKPICRVINLGSVYNDVKYLTNVKQACLDNGLEGYILLTSPYEYLTISKPQNDYAVSHNIIIYRQNKKALFYEKYFL